MTLDIVKLVRADFQKSRPTTWPKIEGTPSTINLEQLWNSMDSTQQILAIVIEEDPFLNGFATIIEYHKNPFVSAIVIPSSHPIAQQFGGVSLPALLVFKRDNPQSLEYSSKCVLFYYNNISIQYIFVEKQWISTPSKRNWMNIP